MITCGTDEPRMKFLEHAIYCLKPNLNLLFFRSRVDGGEIVIILPNLITYDVMKAVTIVTMPKIGNTDELIAPTSCPVLAITKDSSPLAEAIPNPVRNAVMLS